MKQTRRIDVLKSIVKNKILLLDGAMGTMIQNQNLTEDDYRGEKFKDNDKDLKGNNDILSITQPQLIESIHTEYLEAGADIILTNTFNGSSISQADYNTQNQIHELNFSAATIARQAADKVSSDKRPRFVAGSLGPTNKTTSISPDVDDPAFRAIEFDELLLAYKDQATALLKGGVDIFLLETIFDTLNAKAAILALFQLSEETGKFLPIMISGTVTDLSGRTLTGQTPEAFLHSMRHARPFSIGLNCALGAAHMRPYIDELSRTADTLICAYPNAGLPNEFGEYDETPEATAKHIGEWADSGLINMVGGCCGTKPSHIAEMGETIANKLPRKIPSLSTQMRLSGLEALKVRT